MEKKESSEAKQGERFIWSTGQITSADGTKIGYRQVGAGPGLVILHGATRASHHYRQLAEELADAYTIYLPDRRGRGLSGPFGEDYSIRVESADMAALMQWVDASYLFGHSAGGLAGIETALIAPVRKLALYEPAVSIDGSLPVDWLPPFEEALARGRFVAAMTYFLKGLHLSPISHLPRWMLSPLALLLLGGTDGAEMKALLPTVVHDINAARRLDSTHERYRDLSSDTLLLAGQNSPSYFHTSLRILAQTIPQVQLIELPDLDHNAPDLNGPGIVAGELRKFFGS